MNKVQKYLFIKKGLSIISIAILICILLLIIFRLYSLLNFNLFVLDLNYSVLDSDRFKTIILEENNSNLYIENKINTLNFKYDQNNISDLIVLNDQSKFLSQQNYESDTSQSSFEYFVAADDVRNVVCMVQEVNEVDIKSNKLMFFRLEDTTIFQYNSEYLLQKKTSSKDALVYTSFFLPNKSEYIILGNFEVVVKDQCYSNILILDSSFNIKNFSDNINSDFEKLIIRKKIEDIFEPIPNIKLRRSNINTLLNRIEYCTYFENTQNYDLILARNYNSDDCIYIIDKETHLIDSSFVMSSWNDPQTTKYITGITEYNKEYFIIFGNFYDSTDPKRKPNLWIVDRFGNVDDSFVFEFKDGKEEILKNIFECLGLSFLTNIFPDAIIERVVVDNPDTIYVEFNEYFAVPKISKFKRVNVLVAKSHVILFDIVLIALILFLLRKRFMKVRNIFSL